MTRYWTKVGSEYTDSQKKRKAVATAIDEFEWVKAEGEFPMAPGLAIKQIIQQFKVPRVERVAISNAMAPLGLYGIEARYGNGLGRIYVVDSGVSLTPVASDFEPQEGAA